MCGKTGLSYVIPVREDVDTDEEGGMEGARIGVVVGKT